MATFPQTLVLAAAAGTLASMTPDPSWSLSAETLAMLDPSRAAAVMCGGKGGSALRSRLQYLASAMRTGGGAPPPSR